MITGRIPCAVPGAGGFESRHADVGNGERPLVEVAHRLSDGEPISEIRDVRNFAIIEEAVAVAERWDSTRLDTLEILTQSRIRMAKICQA